MTGLLMSYSPPATLSLIGVTPTRPSSEGSTRPVKPGVTWKSCEPLALASPCTSTGALTATGCSVMGLRTRCDPSVHSRDPLTQAPSAAVVRVKVTVNVASAPGASVREDGVTVTSNPGALAVALYVAGVAPTFLTRRVTLSMPASWPTAIDAWLRFDAVTGVNVSYGDVNLTPRLTRYWRYSLAVVGYTSPGSAAPFGLTKPAPCANGSLALETVSPALVIIADLISEGSQSGCRALRRAPMPAMCGDAIDVPDMKSQIRP